MSKLIVTGLILFLLIGSMGMVTLLRCISLKIKLVREMNKLIMFAVLGLLVVGCVCIVSYNNLEKDNRNIEEEKDIVINPITGEKWDSVEEYRFRNTNSSEALE